MQIRKDELGPLLSGSYFDFVTRGETGAKIRNTPRRVHQNKQIGRPHWRLTRVSWNLRNKSDVSLVVRGHGSRSARQLVSNRAHSLGVALLGKETPHLPASITHQQTKLLAISNGSQLLIKTVPGMECLPFCVTSRWNSCRTRSFIHSYTND